MGHRPQVCKNTKGGTSVCVPPGTAKWVMANSVKMRVPGLSYCSQRISVSGSSTCRRRPTIDFPRSRSTSWLWTMTGTTTTMDSVWCISRWRGEGQCGRCHQEGIYTHSGIGNSNNMAAAVDLASNYITTPDGIAVTGSEVEWHG
ncbi:hypothetical protein J4Q44_G00011400, partial [Coregonus suidteri]